MTGTASPRLNSGEWVSFPLYGPWGRWYPWYGSMFGWNLNVMYDPWCYGGTSWMWGRYGVWYDPYSYYYNPIATSRYSCGYMYGPLVGGSGAGAPRVKASMGSLRLKVNPDTAKVYVDNALVGTVDEFSGLSGHLELEGGRHVLEFRAEGYEPFVKEIVVAYGKTQTERISLKKKK